MCAADQSFCAAWEYQSSSTAVSLTNGQLTRQQSPLLHGKEGEGGGGVALVMCISFNRADNLQLAVGHLQAFVLQSVCSIYAELLIQP